MNNLNKLATVLEEEKGLYSELTQLAHDKQQVIINNDVEKLADYLRNEQELIEKIEKKEKERRRVVISLCSDIDMPEQDLSFSKLRDYINDDSKKELEELKSGLLEVLEELQRVNDANKKLIEEALNLNDFNVKILTEATSPSASTYSKKGSNGNKPRRLIDTRA